MPINCSLIMHICIQKATIMIENLGHQCCMNPIDPFPDITLHTTKRYNYNTLPKMLER